MRAWRCSARRTRPCRRWCWCHDDRTRFGDPRRRELNRRYLYDVDHTHEHAVAYLGIHSGLNTMTNTPAASWSLAPTPGFEDVGQTGRGWARRSLSSAGALAPGWTAVTADDFVGSSVAFYEIPVLVSERV